MQHKTTYLLFCKFTLHVSGVNHTHHQNYTNIPPLLVKFFVQLPASSVANLAWPSWRSTVWPVPEAVVTVLCTPVDGCGWHPKHVEWTCRIINRLLCVASRWTIINPLTPYNPYRDRTAPLPSKVAFYIFIQFNIGTKYFNHGVYSPFFPFQNAVCFKILTYLVPVLFTFYIQGVLN